MCTYSILRAPYSVVEVRTYISNLLGGHGGSLAYADSGVFYRKSSHIAIGSGI